MERLGFDLDVDQQQTQGEQASAPSSVPMGQLAHPGVHQAPSQTPMGQPPPYQQPLQALQKFVSNGPPPGAMAAAQQIAQIAQHQSSPLPSVKQPALPQQQMPLPQAFPQQQPPAVVPSSSGPMPGMMRQPNPMQQGMPQNIQHNVQQPGQPNMPSPGVNAALERWQTLYNQKQYSGINNPMAQGQFSQMQASGQQGQNHMRLLNAVLAPLQELLQVLKTPSSPQQHARVLNILKQNPSLTRAFKQRQLVLNQQQQQQQQQQQNMQHQMQPGMPQSMTGGMQHCMQHASDHQIVPPEIRARGARASLAYQEALLEGKVQVRRTRLMLIGQDRAGKTSLKKALLGLPFDSVEPSTDGIEVDPSRLNIEVDQVKSSNWKSSCEQQNIEDQCDREVAKLVAQKLAGHASQLPSPNYFADFQPTEQTHTSDIGEEVSAARDATELDDAVNGAQHTNVNPQMPEAIPEKIASLVTTHLKASDSVKDSESNEIILDIWDFAGQHLYYASHPFFFTPRAIYLLVYNLNKDLSSQAKPCVRQGVHDTVLDNLSNETNLDILLSWLVSVHSMRRAATTSEENRASVEEPPDYESPPVILVGTHADKVHPEEISESQKIIEKKMKGKAYAKHVIGGRFAVDNTRGVGAESLKGKVKEVLESELYMKEWLPVKWFNFEKTVKRIDEEEKVHHKTQEEVRKLAQSECFIRDNIQLETMLNFFHDLGVIVKYRNTVVLQSRWLIDLFKKLITIRPYSEQCSKYRAFWDKLENEGILHQQLIDRAFQDLAPEGNDTKEDMLAMMEEYGLIAKFPLVTESSDEGALCYFVPAQLKTSPADLDEMKPRKGDPCVLIIHFLHGFVPHGLFPQLVSRLIQWCPKVGCTQQPNLYFNAVRCIVGSESQFDLILSCSQRFIRVLLRFSVPAQLANMTSVTLGTIPKDVYAFLKDTLRDMKQECCWLRSMEYEMGVYCLACKACSKPCRLHGVKICPDDDCLHWLPVDESCTGKLLVCQKSFGDHSRFTVPGLKSWYIEEHPKMHDDDDDNDDANSELCGRTMEAWKRGIPSFAELDDLASDVVCFWESLGRQLGVPQNEIDNILKNNVTCCEPREKAFRMLDAWRSTGPSSTYAALAKALVHVGKGELAKTYCQDCEHQ